MSDRLTIYPGMCSRRHHLATQVRHGPV